MLVSPQQWYRMIRGSTTTCQYNHCNEAESYFARNTTKTYK